jgi:hypothetical protein
VGTGLDSQYNSADETKLYSLTDLRLSSYFYSGNYISSIQIGSETTGQIRTIPYSKSTDYSNPTQCYVTYTSTSTCANSYSSSKCANPSSTYLTYPYYDPRCRAWYGLATDITPDGGGDPNKVYFEYPRQSSNSGFVISAVTPLKTGQSVSGSVYGAMTFNILVKTLSDNINNLRILGSGYSYLIDGRNTSRIILHPFASKSCTRVQCAEGTLTD